MRTLVTRNSTLTLAIALAASIAAVLGSPRAVASDDESTAGSAYTIDDLAFFTGRWQGELFGGRSEESWTAPDAGSMLGVFRLMYGETTRVIEFMLITQTETGVVFRFKHYNADYTTWEKGDPLTFDLIKVTENQAVFESSVQEQPKRLTYTVREDGTLSVLVEGVENGEESAFDAIFSRAED